MLATVITIEDSERKCWCYEPGTVVSSSEQFSSIDMEMKWKASALDLSGAAMPLWAPHRGGRILFLTGNTESSLTHTTNEGRFIFHRAPGTTDLFAKQLTNKLAKKLTPSVD
jgi:hypothetical protein